MIRRYGRPIPLKSHVDNLDQLNVTRHRIFIFLPVEIDAPLPIDRNRRATIRRYRRPISLKSHVGNLDQLKFMRHRILILVPKLLSPR